MGKKLLPKSSGTTSCTTRLSAAPLALERQGYLEPGRTGLDLHNKARTMQPSLGGAGLAVSPAWILPTDAPAVLQAAAGPHPPRPGLPRLELQPLLNLAGASHHSRPLRPEPGFIGVSLTRPCPLNPLVGPQSSRSLSLAADPPRSWEWAPPPGHCSLDPHPLPHRLVHAPVPAQGGRPSPHR